jgi:protein-tyrosine sulfotransferase
MFMNDVDKKIAVSKIPNGLISFAFRVGLAVATVVQWRPLYRTGCLGRQPLFILGSGRSGNTLLRSILTAGDDIAIPPESYVLPKVIRNYKVYSFLPWPQVCSLVVGEFQSYKEFYTWKTDLAPALTLACQLPVEQRTLANIIDLIYQEYAMQNGFSCDFWGDKTPINSLYALNLVQVFPEAKYIHLIRDPRAVAVSYRNAGLYDDVFSGVKFWVAANRTIERLHGKVDMYKVSYEEIVARPDESLMTICEHVGLPFKEEMLVFYTKSNRLGDTAVHDHHRNTSRPISQDSIDKWVNELDSDEAAKVSNYAKKYKGYDLR